MISCGSKVYGFLFNRGTLIPSAYCSREIHSSSLSIVISTIFPFRNLTFRSVHWDGMDHPCHDVSWMSVLCNGNDLDRFMMKTSPASSAIKTLQPIIRQRPCVQRSRRVYLVLCRSSKRVAEERFKYRHLCP